jgi:ABC-type transport system involved in cytochrome c biogenesis permease subunit
MLFVALIPACAIVVALGLLAWMKPGSAAARRAARIGGAGLLLLSLAAWVARWLAVGHMPLFGTYESSLSLALALIAVATLTRRDGPVVAGSALLAGALLVHGFRFDPAGYALTISERSIFVDIHALFAWLAFGVLGLNAVLGALEIAGAARGTAGAGPWLARSLHWGFALHSAMMASGSFYKFLLFGTPWSFDPVETLGLLAWLAYGTLLHMHLFAGWEGRRLAGWCLFTFVLLVVSYRGIVYFPAWSTYHIFDMDLRIHLTGKELLQ